MGSAPSSVESVRLDPELKRDLLLRASEDGVSVSETIREALRQYVQAVDLILAVPTGFEPVSPP